jgi:hypothetical protein
MRNSVDEELCRKCKYNSQSPPPLPSPHLSKKPKILTPSPKYQRSISFLQSNRLFSCVQHCNIAPQYCNFDRHIALKNCCAEWFYYYLKQTSRNSTFGAKALRQKIFLFIYFFLCEKLCLIVCTVIDKVILENRQTNLFCQNIIFSPGFDLVSHETTKALSAIFSHETRSAGKNVSTCIFFPR